MSKNGKKAGVCNNFTKRRMVASSRTWAHGPSGCTYGRPTSLGQIAAFREGGRALTVDAKS